MSAVDNGRNSLAGLSLDAILGGSIPHQHRDDETHKDRKSWKLFREKFRLKRAGAAWTSSVHTPTSDVSIPNKRSLNRRSSFNRSEDSVPTSDLPPPASRSAFTRRGSTRFGISSSSDHHNVDQEDILMPGEGPPPRGFKPQVSRHNSTRFPASNEDDDSSPAGRRPGEAFSDDRILSAREAVAAQEASEAEAAAAAAAAAAKEEGDGEEEEEPVKMSLMDLLEETDRAMGLTGSRYAMGDDYDDDEEYYDDDEEEEKEEDGGGDEYTCCVCMVRHKGAAFIPCGHTFCRMCSRELWVQRGNCPLCNGFILEILDIF